MMTMDRLKSGVRRTATGMGGAVAIAMMLVASCGPRLETKEPVPHPAPEPAAPPAPGVDEATRQELQLSNAKLDAFREAAIRRDRNELLRKRALDSLPFVSGRLFPGAVPIRNMCTPGPSVGTIDPHRSLLVHDQSTIDSRDFSFRRTLNQLAQQITDAGVSGVDAEALFRDLWDTQNPTASATTPSGAHCDDDGSTINGFPNSCPRAEGTEAGTPSNLDRYVPVALVNRLDLAHEGWSNCGEYRIIYARLGGPGRNFLIFEAVLPNPSPGCKDGCRPVAEFWANLSTIANPTERAARLEDFFYGDHPSDANDHSLPGFAPVVHVAHYSHTGARSGYGSAGGGQIRSNQFMQSPWTLKEFRTLIDCEGGVCEFDFVPDTVKLNPFALLWSPAGSPSDFGGRLGAFQGEISLQVNALAQGSNAAELSYEISGAMNGAQSNAQVPNGDTAYCSAFGCADSHYLTASLADVNAGLPPAQQLNARHIVNRATALSCGGCHEPTTFGLTAPNSLGPAAATLNLWPRAAPGGFVHVSEATAPMPVPDPTVFGGHPGFVLSEALLSHFLPARGTALRAFLDGDDCACVPRFAERLRPDVLKRLFPRALPPLPAGPIPSIATRKTDITLLTSARREAEQAGVAVVKPLPAAPPSLGVTTGVKERSARRSARVRAVQKVVSQTPPRRTVLGSFRVH